MIQRGDSTDLFWRPWIPFLCHVRPKMDYAHNGGNYGVVMKSVHLPTNADRNRLIFAFIAFHQPITLPKMLGDCSVSSRQRFHNEIYGSPRHTKAAHATKLFPSFLSTLPLLAPDLSHVENAWRATKPPNWNLISSISTFLLHGFKVSYSRNFIISTPMS